MLLALALAPLILAGLPGLVEAQFFGTPEPEPFRGEDEIDGRDFDYNEESFLHRFTFRFRPAAVRDWRRTREGFRGTVGSIRSDEFYVFEEFRKTLSLDGPLYFAVRHKRDEDFDSRYDRTLAGMGVTFAENWHASLFSEIVGEKEVIDLHLELAWHLGVERGVRAAFVPVDVLFNSKTDGLREYERRPFTFFIEGAWRFNDDLEVSGWVNYNSPLRLELLDRGFDFTYDQLASGIEGSMSLTDRLQLAVAIRGETGHRDRRVAAATDPDERRLSRHNFSATVEASYDIDPALDLWFGFRHFRLTERDERPRNVALSGTLRRRENMFFAGVVWRAHPRAILWPGVYLDVIDNRDDFPLDALRNDSDEGLVGKLTCPVEFRIGEHATLTVNPTLLLHELRFGGGNIQVQIPF